MNSLRNFLGLALIIVLLVSGCTKLHPSRTPLRATSATLVSIATKTISPQSAFTPAPTLFIPTTTNTPRSTLSVDEITELVETNGGCIYPCWLGVTPGQSRWDEVKPLLSAFLSINYPPNGPRIELKDDRRDILGYIEVNDNTVKFIHSFEPIGKAPIWKTLSTYGKPGEIRIYPSGNYYGVGLNPYGEFTLVFFYPDRGIMVGYSGRTNAGKILHLCPVESTFQPHSSWLLWDPQEPLTFSQAGDKLRLPAKGMTLGEEYLSIENVTNLSVDTFYATYGVEANAIECFDVQDPDWINE